MSLFGKETRDYVTDRVTNFMLSPSTAIVVNLSRGKTEEFEDLVEEIESLGLTVEEYEDSVVVKKVLKEMVYGEITV